ncbi:MAG: hypothetical protein ACRCTD_16265 [Beijerinckiaceae bacterium]
MPIIAAPSAVKERMRFLPVLQAFCSFMTVSLFPIPARRAAASMSVTKPQHWHWRDKHVSPKAKNARDANYFTSQEKPSTNRQLN